MDKLHELYERKRCGETWTSFTVKPNAISTHRFDDIARLLNGYGGKVLDVGCGAGHLLIGLSSQFNEITGIDLSETAIAVANDAIENHYPELKGRAKFFQGDADRPLPFGDQEFDVVICCAVIEHVVDVFGLLRELARVCRHGGTLVLTTPNVAYIKHIVDLLANRIPLTGIGTRNIAEWEREGWDGGHLHYFTKSQLTELLRWSGFEPNAWTSDGKFAKFRRWSRLFSGNLTVRATRALAALK